MAGKTTWISSMYREDINIKLREICLKNSEGQTKVKTFYKLVNNDRAGIYVESIDLDAEVLFQNMKKEEFEKKIQCLYELGIMDEAYETINTIEKREFISIDLRNKKVDIEKFFEMVINNITIAELDIIRRICICGQAHEQISKIMEKIGIESVTIRDTRGLMDETEKFKNIHKDILDKKGYNKNEANNVSSLLGERGVIGADGCVFVSAGGNALNKKENKERYRFLFESILDDMPSFLLVRSSILEDISNEDFTIEQYKEWMQVDSEYKFVGRLRREFGCKDYVMLLKEFGLFDEAKGLKNQVMKKHYRQLLLPYIDTSDESDREWYIKCSHAAFAMIIEELYHYKKELYKLLRIETELPQRLLAFYDRVFDMICEQSKITRKDGKEDTYMLNELVENVAVACLEQQYYGGLVGVRGGLTTYIKGYGKTGKYAIDILESAYRIWGEIIKLLEAEDSISEEVRIKVYEYLKCLCNKNSFSYSCTNRMLRVNFLYQAWRNLRDNNIIEKDILNDDNNKKSLKIAEVMLKDILLGVLKMEVKNGEHIIL